VGTFSIFHWLIVLLVILGIGILPIALASKSKTLARGPYALRTIPATVVMVLIAAASAELDYVVLVNLVIWVLLLLWSVHRLQDIGWSRWWCLLSFLPFLGLLFWLALLFVPGKPQDESVAEVFE